MIRVVKNFAKSLEVLRNYNEVLLVIKCWLLYYVSILYHY